MLSSTLGTARSFLLGLPVPAGTWSSAKPSSSLWGAMLSEGGPLGLAEEPRCAVGRLGVAFRLEAPISDGASDIITEVIAKIMQK